MISPLTGCLNKQVTMTNLLIRFFVKDAQNTAQPAVRAQYGRLAGWVGIVCNLLLAAAKMLVGLASGSIAIVADAVNNLSDFASSVITLVGFKLAAKPADEEHPFGHARFEYIAGFCVAILVMVVGLELGKSSLDKIIAPTPVFYQPASLVVLAVSVAVKLWMAFFNRNVGRRISSGALAATFADSRNDALSTSAVLLAVLAASFTGLALDGWIGLAVAVFILISGGRLVKEMLDPILGEAPDSALVAHIDNVISATPGVLGTHDLIVHDYGPRRRFASAHVEMDSALDVLESHDIIDKIERQFANEGLNLVIHHDPVDLGASTLARAREQVLRQVTALDSRLSIHDFRIVQGHNHLNYLFDVLAPEDYPDSDEELTKKIAVAIQPHHGFIHAKIHIDRSYAAIP